MDRIEPDAITWAPARPVFVRRVLMTGAITFVSLAAVGIVASGYAGLPFVWAFAGALVLTLGFALEDILRWRSTKTDLWQVSKGMLIHDGPEGRAQIPLSEIESAKAQFGNRVMLKLTSGQRIPMRYLQYPAATATQIEELRGPRRG